MNIYLCGPVSGRPRAEAKAHFENVEQEIRRRANHVDVNLWTENPLRFCPADLEWHRAMKVCIGELARCDGIALLQGWRQSKGAMLELRLAEELHIPVVCIEPPFDMDYLCEIFATAREAVRYYTDRCLQFEKEGVEEPLAEERAMAELSHRYLDPHGFEYINISREEQHGKA